MKEKPYRYRVPALDGGKPRRYGADSLHELADLIVADERSEDFRTRIWHGRGKLIVPPGTARIARENVVPKRVGRARQDHLAKEASRSGEFLVYAPADPERPLIAERSVRELAKAVAAWGVRTHVSVGAEPEEMLHAIGEVSYGRIFRSGKEVQWNEPLRDSYALGDKAVALERMDVFFEIVDRAMRQCKVHVDEIERRMADKTAKAAQYLLDVHDRSGVVARVLDDADDDSGVRRKHVAIVDIGEGAEKRMGVARGSGESESDYQWRRDWLVGREVEFSRTGDGEWTFEELPRYARGLSAAARCRDVGAPALGR